jgi:hypothetical protein
MSIRVLVRFKTLNDYDWRNPEIVSLTRVPLVGEYIAAGPFEFKLCHVTMVIHTPSHTKHEAEIYGDYVERDEAISSIEKIELR